MKSVQLFSAVLLAGVLVTACTSSVIEYRSTHVKDLVQSDVFEVLPKTGMEILIYESEEEIEGEYLTLATVQIKEVSEQGSEETLLEELRNETRELGGNGLLILKKEVQEDGQSITKEWQAVAVFALDRIPLREQYVSL